MKTVRGIGKVGALVLVVLVAVAAVGVHSARSAAAADQTAARSASERRMAPGLDIDREALLAEALGITVDELAAARRQAEEKAIGQMLAAGAIDADQADLMIARVRIEPYADRDALMAEALGITVEALRAARQEGKTERDLLDEAGIDAETFRGNLQAAYEKAVDRALADGAITQAQAEALKEADFQPWGGHGGMGGPGGPGNGGGRGAPSPPDADTETAPPSTLQSDQQDS